MQTMTNVPYDTALRRVIRSSPRIRPQAADRLTRRKTSPRSSTGRTNAGDVLARLGPPGEVGRTGPGYYYLYRKREFGEWGVVLRPFLVSKVGVFSSDGEGFTLVLVFDADDRLVYSHAGDEILPEGWGGLAGHFATGLEFFSIEKTVPVPCPAPWGSPLLELAPTPGDL